MNIIISNSTGQPIYDQIAAQIKNQILSKELEAGTALPSMRLLAKELKVSVITTKRAYEELEKEGLIESYTGKGSFVRIQNEQQLREQHLHEIRTKLQQAIELAALAHIGPAELRAMLESLQEEE
ncbi:GntR family transcriptional regulator [Aminipila butyrica]|uniref:GntR family transcriptional regulator n=1 Tax=Aminipila butyrica TaxID=433296 RepID=A0A858BQM6_9FIRM|nr:GntR family transcriptional regulator [Aminipila butyrica]QIB67827.1 GntR family transcriptional regulator [Aminipila butyrica]